MVTLDDILEEIAGDLKIVIGKGIHKIKDKIYLIDATQIREINKFLNWKIPEDVAKTMNGYILESLEDIPSEELILREMVTFMKSYKSVITS